MATTCDRFRNAALILVGAAPMKQRLAIAWRSCLDGVDESDLPREIRSDFRLVSASLTQSGPVGGLGVVEASVRKMSDSYAAEQAARILSMYGVLAADEMIGRSPALRAVGANDD
jgi:hypothetical protein